MKLVSYFSIQSFMQRLMLSLISACRIASQLQLHTMYLTIFSYTGLVTKSLFICILAPLCALGNAPQLVVTDPGFSVLQATSSHEMVHSVSLRVRMQSEYAMLSHQPRGLINESCNPHRTAVDEAPIQKVCPKYLSESIPAACRVDRISPTNLSLVRARILVYLKKGPLAIPLCTMQLSTATTRQRSVLVLPRYTCTP